MTDYELNRAVAEARGWTGQEEETWWPNTEFIWRDAKGYKVNDLFDVVNEAWGTFYMWLTDTYPQVDLVYTKGLPEPYYVSLWWNGRGVDATAATPGRALALAFLKSRGVSV